MCCTNGRGKIIETKIAIRSILEGTRIQLKWQEWEEKERVEIYIYIYIYSWRSAEDKSLKLILFHASKF